MNIKTIEDFAYVREAELFAIYDALVPAMRYYESDPMQSCMNFRSILKLTVVEAERVTCFVTKGRLPDKLKNLCRYLLERQLMDEEIYKELLLVKRHCDFYHHKEDYPNLNPIKDRLTFYCAFQIILKWLVALPGAFAAFIRAREEEKARIKEEQERKAREEKEREEAARKEEEERRRQEAAEQKRLERNAKAREKRRLEREARERERVLAEQKARKEAKAAEKAAKKKLQKIKRQERMEKIKKVLPWVGYGTLTILGGIAVGSSIAALREASKNSTLPQLTDGNMDHHIEGPANV